MYAIISGATQADVTVANTLDSPVAGAPAGSGIHVTIPSDYVSRVLAGQTVPGCSYHTLRGTTLAVSDAAQARMGIPAQTSGVDPGDLARLRDKLSLPMIGSPLRVTFIGDSITAGRNASVQQSDGFRLATANNLLSRGLAKALVYVGPITSDSAPTNYYGAVGGYTTAQITAIVQGSYGAGKIRAHCYRILAGANDSPAPSNYANDLAALLAAIKTAEPTACVSVAQICPQVTNQAGVDSMNAAQSSVVAAAVSGGQKVVREASPGLIEPTDYVADGVHLAASGNAKEAVVASDGIVAALTAGGYIP